jgi:hypothetical protein
MVGLSKKTSAFFAVLCLFLIFIPKVNFITFEGRETAGIRIDDIILFSASFLIFWAHISLRKPLFTIEKLMFIIIAFSLFSYAFNRVFVTLGILHVDANILYALRIFEYFIFFYVGYYAAQHFKIQTIIWSFFLINVTLMIAQKIGLIGHFSNYGYNSENMYRCCGVSAFPSEMGLVLNMIFCFLLVKTDEYAKRAESFFARYAYMVPAFSVLYPLILFSVFTVLIAINGSRIALAAQGFVFLIFLFKRFSPRSVVLLTLIVCSIGIFFLRGEGVGGSTVTSRMKNLFKYENIELVGGIWSQIDTDLDPVGNDAVIYNEKTQDKSWWMRLHKWAYALKIYVEHPESYLQGVGPGFATAGLDGGIIRIFVEYGIIGSLLFAMLFRLIAKESLMLQLVTIVLLVNMIFFDAYLAYKPMSILFLLTGYSHHKKSQSTIFQNSKVLC